MNNKDIEFLMLVIIFFLISIAVILGAILYTLTLPAYNA